MKFLFIFLIFLASCGYQETNIKTWPHGYKLTCKHNVCW